MNAKERTALERAGIATALPDFVLLVGLATLGLGVTGTLLGGPLLGVLAAVAGPPIARAPNDVGGLLDTSKGWTLNIPMPGDAGSASRAIAQQQVAQPAPAATEPSASAPALASR